MNPKSFAGLSRKNALVQDNLDPGLLEPWAVMLENLRRQGSSIFVYLIFCLLIAIFIINFRPGQTRQGDN